MPTPETRRNMLKSILSSIEHSMSKGKVVREGQLIAYLGIDHGVSRRTALNYLRTLELGGKIVRDDGKIFTREAFDELEAVLGEAERYAEEAERRDKD